MRTMIPILRRVPMPTNSDYSIECQYAFYSIPLSIPTSSNRMRRGSMRGAHPGLKTSQHTTPPPALRAGLRVPWASCAVTLAVAA